MTKSLSIFLPILVFVLLFTNTNLAFAEGSISVSAEVADCNCIYVGVYDMDFGVYDKENGNMAYTEIEVDAPEDHPYTITLDKGQHRSHMNNFQCSACRGNPRKMVGPTEDSHLGYYVFVVNRHDDDDEWGDEGFGNTYMAFPACDWGTGQSQPHGVWGWLPPLQNVTPGLYCDVVTVTVHP